MSADRKIACARFITSRTPASDMAQGDESTIVVSTLKPKRLASTGRLASVMQKACQLSSSPKARKSRSFPPDPWARCTHGVHRGCKHAPKLRGGVPRVRRTGARQCVFAGGSWLLSRIDVVVILMSACERHPNRRILGEAGPSEGNAGIAEKFTDLGRSRYLRRWVRSHSQRNPMPRSCGLDH